MSQFASIRYVKNQKHRSKYTAWIRIQTSDQRQVIWLYTETTATTNKEKKKKKAKPTTTERTRPTNHDEDQAMNNGPRDKLKHKDENNKPSSEMH